MKTGRLLFPVAGQVTVKETRTIEDFVVIERTSLLANPVDFSKLNDHTTVEGSWNPSDMGNVRDVVRKKILSANTMSYPDEEWVEDFLSFYDIEEEKTKPKTKKKISEKGNTPKKKAREKRRRKRPSLSQPKPAKKVKEKIDGNLKDTIAHQRSISEDFP